MIKNERQYAATQKQASRFETTYTSLSGQPVPLDANQIKIRQIQLDAAKSQLDDLKRQLREYDLLKSGVTRKLTIESLSGLPYALIAGRISSGMSQKELAHALNMHEQVIQRYEANDYAGVSLAKITEIGKVLNLQIREDVLLPSAKVTTTELFRKLSNAGVDRSLVETRIVPPNLSTTSDDPDVSEADATMRAAELVGRVFNFNPSDIFGTTQFAIPTDPLTSAWLKAPSNSNVNRQLSYAAYARYIAIIVLKATHHLPIHKIPATSQSFREAVMNAYGTLSFESTLSFCWGLGIPVVPLGDSGAFHGATWRINGRNVIVLKQRDLLPSRWLVTLLHEIRHCLQDSETSDLSFIDEDFALKDRDTSQVEEDATWFAIDVALNEQAESLVDACLAKAQSQVNRLSHVVPQVAHRAQVDLGVLADYLAFRLGMDGHTNWWGAATNLQPQTLNPLTVCRHKLFEHLDLTTLDQPDTWLLQRAFHDSAEP